MSSSIAIPSRRLEKRPQRRLDEASQYTGSSSNSSYSSTPNSAAPSPHNPSCSSSTTSPMSTADASPSSLGHRHRPSLLSESLSKQEHTVINVGRPDGPPRLITCVRSSQGFEWNQDMFLPSYGDRESSELERRPDPVHEIVLSEEDLRDIFPK